MKSPTYLTSTLILCAVLCLLTGCETTTSSQADKSTVQPAASVEVFRDDAKPSRPYKEIGVLTDDGREAEQTEIETKMIKRAAKMRGHAIIFEKPKQSGVEIAPFSFGKGDFTYLYKGTVVVYQ